jgi:N6-adenosine-specific RNA methylase IME4
MTQNLRTNVISRLLAIHGNAPFMRDRPCRVLTADPAWMFNDKLPGAGRGAAKNYREQHMDDIINRRGFEFDWPSIDDDCILFLWRVASQADEAYDVMRGWGFEPKSEIIWCKYTKNGKKWMGMGRTGRQSHEVCIIGTRGRSANVMQDLGVRSTFDAKVPCYEWNHPKVLAGKVKAGSYIHSGKPEEFRDLVTRMVKGPYVELFGRRTRPGWDVRGNEVWDGVSKTTMHVR